MTEKVYSIPNRVFRHDTASPFGTIDTWTLMNVSRCPELCAKLEELRSQFYYANQSTKGAEFRRLFNSFHAVIKNEAIIESPYLFIALWSLYSAYRLYSRKIPDVDIPIASVNNLSHLVDFSLKNDRDFTTTSAYDPDKKIIELVNFNRSMEDPNIVMDPGDIFLILNNLIRDATTHSHGAQICIVVNRVATQPNAVLQIDSPGYLDQEVLNIIGKRPYSTREGLHGYGKISAHQLVRYAWADLLHTQEIPLDLEAKWENITCPDGKPIVRWTAPLPLVK